MSQSRSLVLLVLVSVTTIQTRQSRPFSHLAVSISDQFPQQSCISALHNLNHLLTSSSSKLHSLTNLQIHRVTVVLPPSWYNTSCMSGLLLSPVSAALSFPDIFLSSERQAGISVTQYAGCGNKGKDVTIPADVLEDDFNKTETSLDLVDSLLKYQFGLFATHGQANDPKFPEKYNLGEQEIENCKNEIYEETSYDALAPTKQNLLCNGQSPISIIRSHLSDKQVRVFKSPKLEFVISHKTRFLLVLDRSMQAEQIWKHLHNALFR